MIECVTFYGDIKLLPKERLAFRPSVYGIIEHMGCLLLVKNRNTGKYALPGGGVDVGEVMADALQREVKEEAGISIDVGDFLEFSERFFYYDPEDLAFHGLCFFYRCKPVSFDLAAEDEIVDDEACEPNWFAVADLRADMFQHSGDLILKWVRDETSI